VFFSLRWIILTCSGTPTYAAVETARLRLGVVDQGRKHVLAAAVRHGERHEMFFDPSSWHEVARVRSVHVAAQTTNLTSTLMHVNYVERSGDFFTGDSSVRTSTEYKQRRETQGETGDGEGKCSKWMVTRFAEVRLSRYPSVCVIIQCSIGLATAWWKATDRDAWQAIADTTIRSRLECAMKKTCQLQDRY